MIYATLLLIMPFVIKTVDPIPLSGFLDVFNKTPYWSEFSDKESNMIKITCQDWNKLPNNDRDKITLRYTLMSSIAKCNPHTNKIYESCISIIYSSVVINKILWMIMMCMVSRLVSSFSNVNKIMIYTLFTALLAATYIDIYSLTSIKNIHALTYGEIYNVNGYVNISNYEMPIYDQFQLSELVCKLISNPSITYVDVYLSECSVDNNFFYYSSMMTKIIVFILYIPYGIYIGVSEMYKSNEEYSHLTIL